MHRGQLAQAPDEYRQLFQFFFVFRVIALAFGLIWILFKLSLGANYTLGLVIWVVVLLYTVVIYTKRRELYALLTRHAVYLGADIIISMILLMVYNAWDSPFYFYSISPVIPAGVMFRFKGAAYSSVLLTATQVVSIFVHGATLQGFFSLEHFPLFLGQITAYFTVGFMLIYPSDMIAEIVRQRSVIKEQAEREAISEERARLARELHDNLAQMLSAIKLKADALCEKLSARELDTVYQMRELVSATLRDLRNAIYALRPENIEQDLSRVLTHCCRRFSSATGCKIDTNFSIDGLPLSAEQKYEILRICQEALSNATRHSGAGMVRLEALEKSRELIITVEDSGDGFDPTSIQAGVGLLSMRERAEKLRGTLAIITAEGVGTKVKLSVPLRNPGVNGDV